MKLTTISQWNRNSKQYGWTCYDERGHYLDPVGHGVTEEAAIIDFVRQICEDVDWPEDTGKEDRLEKWDRYNGAHTLEDYLDF